MLNISPVQKRNGTNTHLLHDQTRIKKDRCPRCRLYASHALSKFSDRLWAFAIPVLFVRVWPGTFLPAATFTLALYAFTFIFMVYVGDFVDKNDRMHVVRTAIFGQKCCVLGSCALMYLILQLGTDTDTLGIPFTNKVCACFGALLLVASVGELLGSAGCIALEKDWVVVLAAELSETSDDSENSDDLENSDDSEESADTKTLRGLNATLQRIDLLCALLAPMLFGVLIGWIEHHDGGDGGGGGGNNGTSIHNKSSNATLWAEENRIITYGVLSISLWNCVSLLPEYYLASSLYHLLPALQSKITAESKRSKGTNHVQSGVSGEKYVAMDDDDDAHDDDGTAEPKNRRRSPCHQIAFGWGTYVKSPIALPSLGYCFLYLTVLSNGVLMTQYLLENNVPEWLAGASRGVGAVFGIAGTLIYPCLMRCRCCRGSLEVGGVVTGWLFFFTVAPAGLAVFAHAWGFFGHGARWYFFNYTAAVAVPYVCLGFTLVARCWLWAFDVNHCQVMQERVPEAERGVVNGTESALYRLMTMVISVLGMVFQKPAQFYILALVSIGAVFLAAVSYTLWWLRQRLSRRHLVGHEPGQNVLADVAG